MINAEQHHDPAKARDTLKQLKKDARFTWPELGRRTGCSSSKLRAIADGRNEATYADQELFAAMYREECVR